MFKNKPFTSRRVFAFRQWSRKSYAVFNSLKLLIKISVLSAVYTLINPVQECKAQSDSTQQSKIIELDEVEVSGQRTPVVYSQISRVVSVITRNDIEQAPVQSVNELLENIPQVDVRQRGTNGVQADISIQGGSFDQTLILLNGINLTDPQTGHHNLNLPIDIESIDRVEVLKGPASRVFGTNAFSGAVNFVTGENPNDYVKASIAVGFHGLYRGSFSFNKHVRNFQNFASISKGSSDGYIANTDYKILNAFYHSKLNINKGVVSLQLGASQKDFGANSFYTPRFPNQFETTQTYFGNFGAEFNGKIKVLPNFFWRRNYDHYILIRSNPEVYQNFHFTDVYGASINTSIDTPEGKTSLGMEFRKEVLYSTNLGQPLSADDYKKVPDEKGKYYNKKDWRNNYSIFAEHNIYSGNISTSVGLMVNANTKFSGIELYPGLDMSYKFHDALKVYYSINRSLRLPSFTDLYYQGPQNRGNADLKPESAWTFETGFKYKTKGIEAHVSYFHREGTNIIDWIWQDTSQVWHTENLTELNTDGIEVSAILNKRILHNISPLLNDFRVSYMYTHITKFSDNKKSNYALDNLKHKFGMELGHTIFKNFGALWRLSYQDRNGGYLKWDAQSQKADSIESAYKPFVVLDAKAYYTFRYLKLFVECNNILDNKYFDFGNLPQLGIWLKGGLEIKLGI